MKSNANRVSGTARGPMERRTGASQISEKAMVENFEEPKQPRVTDLEGDQGSDDDMTANFVERAPYADRLRMIILLSLLCWAALVVGAVLAFG